ncbi:hypothetical protein ACTFIU_002400 [Dictyostelium citrinum]
MNEKIENDILFFKVWKNIVIREIILKHIKLFKRNYYFKIHDFNSFKNKINKYYVQKIDIYFNNELQDDILSKYINCTNLKFSNKFNKSINNLKLSNNIKYLEFGNLFDQPLIPLDQLFIHTNNSLESIKFGNNFNQKLIIIESIENHQQQIFSQLKTLILGIHFNQPLLNIPNSITYLEFGRDFDQDFTFSKFGESKLKCLKFKGRFNKVLKVGNLPSSLRILYLSDQFNKKLTKGMLPEGLEELYFQSNYNQELIPNESIPSSLKLIVLSFSFNQELLPNVFPPNIETIIFGQLYSKPIKMGVIPDNVTNLKLPKFYKTFVTLLPQTPMISQLYSIPPKSYKKLSFYDEN